MKIPRIFLPFLRFVLIFLSFMHQAIAQSPLYEDYDWKEKPILHDLNDEEAKEQELTLKDKRVIEYFYDDNNNLFEYNLKHKIIKVNSDKAIQMNNRIYIPFSNSVSVVKEKARVINSEGKVRELKEEDVREAKDEETNQTYRYFAVEGVDIGSEIEYFYVVQRYPSYVGSQIVLQSEELVKNAAVEIISPKNLVFATKSYNGLPEMQEDTSFTDRNYLRVEVDRIPKLQPEESAAYKPHLQQLIYKLEKNYYTGRKEVISYEEAAKALYQSIYMSGNKKTEKGISKLIKEEGFGKNSNFEERVRNIENYLKTNFTVVDFSADELGDLEKVLENKVCNDAGITKLFAQILTELEIEHRIVLTSDRNELKFDPEFEAYNFLQHYLIYFPDIKKYLAPSSIFHRLGFIPSGWMHNYGLFLEPFKMGDYQTALPKIKFIDAPAFDESTDKLFVKVNFDQDFSKLDIEMQRESAGYYAQATQPYYDFINPDQKKDVSESMVKLISPDAEIRTIESENEGSNLFGVKPFIIKSELTSSSFIEKAGPKYLFKIGELIGPQIEMYQEEERILEVENDFARKYHREIEFNVPDQYQIKNLDALKMDVSYSEKGNTMMAFVSDYSVDGNQVKVSIREYYTEIIYPLELFEEYRKVINAAADFNKISLLLEKK